MNFTDWEHAGLKISGFSLSGIRTSFVIKSLGICFDVANGHPAQFNIDNFFISHGHLDHCGGIPYIISQKAMAHLKAPKFFMPKSLIEPMTEIMNLWEKIEKHKYDYHFIAVDDLEQISLNANYYIKPLKSKHRIDSFGYCLFHTKKKLDPKFENQSQDDLAKLAHQGAHLSIDINTPMFTFSGDTEIDFLLNHNEVRQSKILFMECTYLDDRKSVEHAKKWGHTHLHELLDHLPSLQNEKIVIIHISSRYSNQEAIKLIKSQVPMNYQNRIEVFPGR